MDHPSAPAYGLLQPDELTHSARRRFLKGGAFLLGFAWLGKNNAWAAASVQTFAPDDGVTGGTFSGFAPGGFIRIDEEGGVHFIIPATEMGQGIYTGQAMLIAEELEVGLDQVQIHAAPADGKLYLNPLLRSQATGGSSSIRSTWMPLRQAGAAARTMLIEAAARRWNVPRSQCFAERGSVHCRVNSKSLSYGALAGAARQLPVPGNVVLKKRAAFKLIGRSLPRVETPAKANGTAMFGIDVRLPGMKVAVCEICPLVGGRLDTLDAAAARQVPGVVDVLRIDDAVAVVADHFWAAKKGVEALRIRWAPGTASGINSDDMWRDLKAASESGKPIPAPAIGDADQAMAKAAKRIDAVYELPFLAHATLEPINTTMHVRADRCDIWVGTQAPGAVQGQVAHVLGMKPEQIFVHNHLMGGGFGRRLIADTVVQAARFARQVPYPLKLVWTREQDIRHDRFRPAYLDRVAAGLDADGRPVAWTHRVTGGSVLASFLPTGFPPDVLDTDAVEGAAQTPYAFPASRVDWIRKDPPVQLNWWRGVGPAHNVFVVESFLDECAHAAGRDPVAYRRALLRDNPRALRVLELAAEKAGWGGALPPRTGRGISLHHSFGSFVALACEVRVTDVGEINLRRLVAAIDCGIVINPDSVIAQIEGGVIFGLSAALYNEITLSNGQVVESNFHDYRQIRINEIPPFETHLVPSDEEPGGVGETGTVSAAPALANAIFAATGVRLRRLPIERASLALAGSDKKVLAGSLAAVFAAGWAGEEGQ